MRTAGHVKYPWVAGSRSSTHGLGYNTRKDAEQHAASMNKLLDSWDELNVWNKDFWKSKPQEWIIEEVEHV